jgi:fimbrial chaperone protein
LNWGAEDKARDRGDIFRTEDMLKLRLTDVLSKWRLGAFVVVMGIVASTSALAMRVSPMVSELSSSGSGAVARIEVGNVGSVSMPFETKITRIEFTDDGKLVETPGDDDFITFPPQGLVPVSGRQVVRVQWIGRPDIPTSQAYYLWVRQLPVETNPQKIQGTDASVSIDILYTMKALIIVAPPGAKPDVQVESAVPETITLPAPEPVAQPEDAAPIEAKAPEPQPGLKVVVTNKGTRYALMSGAKWVVNATGIDGQPFERTYGNEEVSRLLGVGYVAPAGGKRTFAIPTGVALDPAKPITMRFIR